MSSHNFQDEALILLNNRFAGRIQSVDIVEQSLLLDGIVQGLQTKHLTTHLALKGGGALQRGYDSERFSADLDFACGKNPPFSADEFEEFGQDFCHDFANIVKECYDINQDNITVVHPDKRLLQTVCGDHRAVASWEIRVIIPPHMSLLNRNRSRSPYGREKVGFSRDIQYVKVQVCNVPTYLSKNYLSLLSSSSRNTFLSEGNVQNLEEIFYDKICCLLSRQTFKPYDVFDMFFAEGLSGFPVDQIDKTILNNKLNDQKIIFPSLKERIHANKVLLQPTNKNVANFLTNMQNLLTYVGYKSIFASAKNLLAYAQNRIDYCLNILHPRNEIDLIPLDGVADTLLTLYKTEEHDNTQEEHHYVAP